MERVAELAAIVQRELVAYDQVASWKARSFFVADTQRQIYTVLVVPDLPRPFTARVEIMARIVDDKIVIEEDTTDRPLVEALVRAGVPREQIILVYAGETVPEALST